MHRKALSSAITAALLASAVSPLVLAQDAAEEMQLEEVLVTATRRSESIKDIPYNISAVGGDFIDGGKIMTTAELLQGVPGAAVVDYGARNAGTVNTIRIRGLSLDNAFAGDPQQSAVATVSTYLNDTPVFANLVLKDLERVEVLRGPQGTL
jgi:outer membrane receptor protein involved in Fe transport